MLRVDILHVFAFGDCLAIVWRLFGDCLAIELALPRTS